MFMHVCVRVVGGGTALKKKKKNLKKNCFISAVLFSKLLQVAAGAEIKFRLIAEPYH